MIESFDRAAQRFKAMSDPTRLAILALLEPGTRCVCEIQPRLGIAPNLLSHHLKMLREAGLVSAQKNGRRIEYSLEPSALLQLHAAIPSPKVAPTAFQSLLNDPSLRLPVISS